MVSSWILIFVTVTTFQGHQGYVSGPIAHLDMSIVPDMSLIDSGSAIGNQNLPVVRTPASSTVTPEISSPIPVNLPVSPPKQPSVKMMVNAPKMPSSRVPVKLPKMPSIGMSVSTPKPSSGTPSKPSKMPFPGMPVQPPKMFFPDMSVNTPKPPSSGIFVNPPKTPSPGLSYLPPANPSYHGMTPSRRPHKNAFVPSTASRQSTHFFPVEYHTHYSNAPVFPPSVSHHLDYYQDNQDSNNYKNSYADVYFPTDRYHTHSIFKRQIGRPQSGPFFNQNGFNNNGFGSAPPGAGNWGNSNPSQVNFQRQPQQQQQPWWANGGFASNNPDGSGVQSFEFSDTTTRRPGRPNRPVATQTPPTQPAFMEFTEEATVPTAGTTRRGCVCPTTPEFNPVCGEDRVTYFNAGRLRCANQCGNRVALVHGGACVTSTTAAVTTPSILNQRRSQG